MEGVPDLTAMPAIRRPQLVAITFDDGFGLEAGGVGGVNDIVAFCEGRANPPGTASAATFDGAPVRVTFYLTTTWGQHRENLDGWARARAAGHELANHTESHPNGGEVAAGSYLPRNFDLASWRTEMSAASAFLRQALGVGGGPGGFRAPFLAYNDAMFAALRELGFLYDSSILGGLLVDEDGRRGPWPYRLDRGSIHAAALHDVQGLPRVGCHPGLWEVPVSTLTVPPDDLAGCYGVRPGLRGRIVRSMPYPSLCDSAAGKIAGLDYTLLVESGLAPEEMTAILAHTLDLRLAGNRAPLVFAGHTFMYAFSDRGGNPNTASLAVRAARWQALASFIEYALSRREVRLCSVKDVVSWMARPAPLGS
jgi:hypothetical protein